MKKISLVFSCILFASTVIYATPCEDVMQIIAEKIKKNGVKEFVLESIDKGSSTDKKIVGVCREGSKDIIYYKGKPAENASESIMIVTPEDTTDTSETQTLKN